MSAKSHVRVASAVDQPRDVRHLGDFTVTPRMLVIAALAVPVGAVAPAWRGCCCG